MHAPQLFGSEFVSTHVPPQSRNPEPGQVQVPFSQDEPDAHTVWQLPQFIGS